LIVHGNHEDEKELEIACSRYENIKFIHNKIENLENLIFLGYGGGGFTKEDPKFEMAMENFMHLKEKDFVLVTHAPPYRTKVDELMDGHSGNISIRRFIEATSPKLVVCGHLHENDGKTDYIGETKVINPGYRGMIIDL